MTSRRKSVKRSKITLEKVETLLAVSRERGARQKMKSRRKSVKRSKILKKRKGSGSELIPWDELPNDVLEKIMKKVIHADRISIRCVCKKWNVQGEVPALKQFPWLVDFTDKNSWGSFKMIDPYDKDRIYDVEVKDRRLCRKSLEQVRVHECKKGWFLMSIVKHFKTYDTYFILFSPFFKCQIMELPQFRSSFKLVSFSSSPRDEDCIFFALDSTGVKPTTVAISTCTKKDKMWLRLCFECDPDMSYDFCSVVHVEKECSFYCLAKNGSIGIYNTAEQSWRVERFELQLRKQGEIEVHRHLIQPYGYILMIDIVPKSTDFEYWNLPNYAVYNLDKQNSKWTRLGLGDMNSEVFFFGGCGAAIPSTWGSNTSIPTTSGGNRVFYSSGAKIKQFAFSDISKNGDVRSHPCQKYYGESVIKPRGSGRMTFIEAPQ